MRWAIPFLGLAAQVPFQAPQRNISVSMDAKQSFSLKSGNNIFSPVDLVELARPGQGIANEVGDAVLVSASKYSFKDKENRKSIWIAPIESTASPLEIPLAKGGDAFWLDSRTVGHAVDNGNGQELYAISIKVETQAVSTPKSPVLLGTFPVGATAANFRYSILASRLVFSAYVYSDYNLSAVKEHDEAWENRGSTALVYDSTFVRHWDTWRGPKRSTLFSVSLAKEDGIWRLGDDFIAPLKGSGHHVPVEPFGGLDDFDITDSHLVYTAKDPALPPATHTKQNIYLVNFMSTEKPRELTSGKQGATHSPVFSKEGDKVAWLEQDMDGYESDRAKIIIYDLTRDVRYTLTSAWDRSPDSLAFSLDGQSLFFTAGDEGHVKIFTLPVPNTPNESTTAPPLPPIYQNPVALTHSHSASAVQPLTNGRLLYTQSSLTSPNDVFVIRGLENVKEGNAHVFENLERQQITRFTADNLKGKDLDQGESFWFHGADDRKVQGWAIKPKGWKAGEKKKWPVVLLIHGGPQSAWEDQWSTRWNPNVFAQQGYFTIAINPTGSTTFGQDFVDAIAEDWGGRPFVDLRKGWKYVLNKFPEIDPDRAAAAGASWGGYAINWIQGHPEYDFGFKALVCHDGVFDSNYNGYSTDELFFFNHDFGGRPWDKKAKEISERFSPVNFVHKWSTPQLLIHGSKDYRLPETESIGAFHALQQRGIPSRLVIFPDENHFVLNHGNSLKWHYEVFRWFDEYVGKHKE